jgi:hypothetical protein
VVAGSVADDHDDRRTDERTTITMALTRSRKLVLLVGAVLVLAVGAVAVAQLVDDDEPGRRLVEASGGNEVATASETTLPDAAAPGNDKAGPTTSTTSTTSPAAAPAGSESSSPPPPGGFPNPASTGVPAGWTPAQTLSTDMTIRDPGTVVEDIRFTDGASIAVYADNVTIRRVEMLGGRISNQYGDAPANCGHDMVIENVTFKQEPGQFVSSDVPVIGEGSYTARNIEVDGRGEGPRLSDCGPVTLENSFMRIHGADEGTPACDEVHSDGVQAVAGVGATARNNTIIFETSCGTSPWFVVNPSVNTGTYTVDRLLVSGGGYSFRQQVTGSVTGLRIVDGAWVFGPLDEMDCSRLSNWEAKLVTIDSNFQVTGDVRDQPCG